MFSLEFCWCHMGHELTGNSHKRGVKWSWKQPRTQAAPGRSHPLSLEPRGFPDLCCSVCVYTSLLFSASYFIKELPWLPWSLLLCVCLHFSPLLGLLLHKGAPFPHTFLPEKFDSPEISWLWRHPSMGTSLRILSAAVPAVSDSVFHSESWEKTLLGPACLFTLDHILGSFHIRPVFSALWVTAGNILSVPRVLARPKPAGR